MTGYIDRHLVCDSQSYRDEATRVSVAWTGTFSGLSTRIGPELCRLYQQHGPEFISHVRGWFAVVLQDEARNLWCLARDPSGTIPLYYTQTANRLYFSDRIADLLPHLPDVELHPPALFDFLTYLWTLEDKTFFKGVHLVSPGAITLPEGKKTFFHFVHEPKANAPTEWEASILETLHECVSDAAMPQTACHLSGGIDSSLVVGFAAKGSRVGAYGTSFPDYPSYDESVHARVAAERFNVPFKEVSVRAEDVPEFMQDLTRALEEPKCHPSVLGRYRLEDAVAADGFRCVLTGRGADELFTGYASHEPDALVRHRERRTVFTEAERLSFLQPDFVASIDYSPVQAYNDVHMQCPGDSPLERMLAFDFRTLMANWMVVDYKMSAARGIACRAPFLDQRMIDLALSIPVSEKSPGGQPKALLRRAAARVLPQALIGREKVGFRTPMGEMLRDSLEEFTRDQLQPDNSPFWDWFSPQGVGAVLSAHFEGARNYGWQIWALLSVRAWCRQFLEAPVVTP